jgi:hypothetical protein
LRCRDFLPKCSSIEKLRLQEAQYRLFLNRDLCTTAAITLVQANIFCYMEKVYILYEVFYVLSKNAANNFVTLMYELLGTQEIAFARS